MKKYFSNIMIKDKIFRINNLINIDQILTKMNKKLIYNKKIKMKNKKIKKTKKVKVIWQHQKI